MKYILFTPTNVCKGVFNGTNFSVKENSIVKVSDEVAEQVMNDFPKNFKSVTKKEYDEFVKKTKGETEETNDSNDDQKE